MATVDKTFSWQASAEGWTDNADSGITASWLSSDGNPLGSIQFVQTTKSVTQSERWRNNATYPTWETMGVPAGATVTEVQFLSGSEKLASNTKLTSHLYRIQLYETVGGLEQILTTPPLAEAALGTTVDSAWQAMAVGPTGKTVAAAYQASNTPILVAIFWECVTGGGGGGANVNQRFDEITLRITYTVSSPSLDAQPGSFSLTGSDAGTVSGRVVNSDPGAFTLTGLAATVVAGRVTSADPGSYALSGAASSLIAARVLDSTPGTFTFTGIAATLLHSAGATDYPLDAQPGTFTLTGTLASVVAGRMVLASPGSYVLTGVLVENPTTRVMSAIPGEFILTGIAAGLVHTVPGSPTSHNRTTLGVGT